MPKFPNKNDLFFITEFDNFANEYINKNIQNQLTKPISYTLLAKTKRFRPLLSMYTAKTLGLDYKKVLAWALSIEMVHNFSLIHDDLPCMDDDDLRRAKPSNHKVFGEALALLSGNSLLVEAFAVLIKYFSDTKSLTLCVSLIKEISKATGANGMMLGQAGDLILNKKILSKNVLKVIPRQVCNELKTGALIKISVLGVLYIYKNEIKTSTKKNTNQKQFLEKNLIDFSFYLGRAFQWADDLADQEAKKNIIEKKLKNDSQKALDCLKALPQNTKYLKHLVIANQTHFK